MIASSSTDRRYIHRFLPILWVKLTRDVTLMHKCRSRPRWFRHVGRPQIRPSTALKRQDVRVGHGPVRVAVSPSLAALAELAPFFSSPLADRLGSLGAERVGGVHPSRRGRAIVTNPRPSLGAAHTPIDPFEVLEIGEIDRDPTLPRSHLDADTCLEMICEEFF